MEGRERSQWWSGGSKRSPGGSIDQRLADSHHFDDEQDTDPHSSEKLDPDPH